MKIPKLTYVLRWSRSGWQVRTDKPETYGMWLFFGPVERDGLSGTLLCVGPLYFIFKLTLWSKK